MAERFYINCPLGPGPVLLQGPEAHHLAVVCRVRPGDRVCLFNGDGSEYPAEVRAAAKREVSLEVLSAEQPVRELTHHLSLVAPLPKGDRAQFLIEKLTELGVTRFIPLRTRRSIVHPGDAKHDKLQRWVIEASKQCGRNRLLIVEPLVEWAPFCARGDLPECRIVAHPGGTPLPPSESRDSLLAVGPEGGWMDEEIVMAQRHGWQIVGLGARILRIETAAIALAAWAARLG